MSLKLPSNNAVFAYRIVLVMAIVTAQTQNWSKYLATFLILNTYNFIYQTKLPITSLKHKQTTGKGFPFSKLFLQLT